MGPLAEQSYPMTFSDSPSTLLVDAGLKSELDGLRSEAMASGWVVDTPLVGLAWRWNASVPFFLAAQVPDSLMLTIFGYEPATEIAQYNLFYRSGNFPWEKAWILSSKLGSEVPDWPQVDEVVGLVESQTGLDWPGDYELAATSQSYMLWKPGS